jgi:hypothetical protein
MVSGVSSHRTGLKDSNAASGTDTLTVCKFHLTCRRIQENVRLHLTVSMLNIFDLPAEIA